MKTIDIKSLMIGALAAILIIALTSSAPNEESPIQFVGSSAGLGIWNKQTQILYLYKMLPGGNMKREPSEIFKIEEGGARLKDIEH